MRPSTARAVVATTSTEPAALSMTMPRSPVPRVWHCAAAATERGTADPAPVNRSECNRSRRLMEGSLLQLGRDPGGLLRRDQAAPRRHRGARHAVEDDRGETIHVDRFKSLRPQRLAQAAL